MFFLFTISQFPLAASFGIGDGLFIDLSMLYPMLLTNGLILLLTLLSLIGGLHHLLRGD
jgi:hypothetical protein